MQIVRKKLTASEISPANQRWDEACNCPQITPDNGATWNNAVGLDTRHVDGYRSPALSSGDPQCDAAANMVAEVRASVDLIVSRGTVVGAASSLLDLWLLAIGPVGWLIDLIVIGIEATLAIGVIAVDAAFTDSVYHDLLCIFYTNMDSDGQVSAVQFDNILTAIDGLDSVVNATMDAFFSAWGEVGLSNAGATGHETGDCSACICDGCFEWDFAIDEQGFSVCSIGTYVTAAYWDQVCAGGFGSDSTMNIGQGFGSTPFPVDHVELDLTLIALPTDWYVYGLDSDTGTCGGDQVLLASGTASSSGTVTADFSEAMIYGLQVITNTTGGCGTGDAQLTAVRVHSSDLCAIGLVPNC